MLYAHLSVFTIYSAFITAENEDTFLEEFKNVVLSALNQYENCFGAVGKESKDRIRKDLVALTPVPFGGLQSLSYDLGVDGNGYSGIISVIKVFTDKEEVERIYRPFIDDLNKDIEDEDGKWAVFDGGFFPSRQGFEIDELFK